MFVTVNRSETNSKWGMGKHTAFHSRILNGLSKRQHESQQKLRAKRGGDERGRTGWEISGKQLYPVLNHVTGYLFLSLSRRLNVYSQQKVKQSHWTSRWRSPGDHEEERGVNEHDYIACWMQTPRPFLHWVSGSQNTSSQTFTHLVRPTLLWGTWPNQGEKTYRY